MKIEQHYPDRKSLAMAEEPYKEALLVLNTLYMEAPTQETKALSTKDVVDYYMLSCAHTIADKLTEEVASFPSVLMYFLRRTYIKTNRDNMDFNNFWVNADYEQAALYGIVYYVLACQQNIPQNYLDFIEKQFSRGLDAYFHPFKEAAEKKLAELDRLKKSTKKDEAKKLTVPQAGLFCEVLLDKLNCTYSNKKETIAPIASGLFGWSKSSLKRDGFSYTPEDRAHVAGIFKDIDSEFSKDIMDYGKKKELFKSQKSESGINKK